MDDRELSSVRDGAVGLKELMSQARELVASEDGQEALYDGMRDRVSTLLRSEGSSPNEIQALQEALARLASLAWGNASSDAVEPLQRLAIRLEVLANQAADAVAFSETYTLSALRRQPHFEACILLLASRRGSTSRSDVLDTLGLKEANGTRVLKVLEKARLLVRHKRSQSVDVELTELGRRVADAWAPARGGSSSRLALSEPVDGMSRSEFSVSTPISQVHQ